MAIAAPVDVQIGAAVPLPNAYFDALVARPDWWKSWSLRNDAQVVSLRAQTAQPAAVRYLYPNDPYPQKQDGAKVVIPPFVFQTTLLSPISSIATTLTLGNTTYTVGRQLQLDEEIVIITAHASGSPTYSVQRGYFGTVPSAHVAGLSVGISTNSLQNMVWLPLGGTNDHQYLFTWDAWFGNEFMRSAGSGLATYKNFQLDSTGIWFETRTRFDQVTGLNVGTVDARAYGPLGPNIIKDQPLTPFVGVFTVKPETWTRYWVHCEMKSLDWDLNSLWVADENHDAVQIIDRRQMENNGQMVRFRMEYNTSQDPLGANRGDLTGYLRNFWAGRDVPYQTVPSFFARPVG